MDQEPSPGAPATTTTMDKKHDPALENGGESAHAPGCGSPIHDLPPATNGCKLRRPDNPLRPNYTWVPIGYHGRASTLVVSGTPVVRPSGQTKAADAAAPLFGPSKRLDYECEIGFVVGPSNRIG